MNFSVVAKEGHSWPFNSLVFVFEDVFLPLHFYKIMDWTMQFPVVFVTATTRKKNVFTYDSIEEWGCVCTKEETNRKYNFLAWEAEVIDPVTLCKQIIDLLL